MGQVSRNVGDFNKTSTGTTVYGPTVTFDVPANAGITGCTTTFTTHVNSGSFRYKAFLINGQEASDSGLSTTGNLNPALLVTGQNTFRVAINAQPGKTATWSISNIQLHITYNDPSGGSVNIGTFGTNTGRLTAGEQIRLTLGACDPSISREISVWYGDGYNSQIGTVPGIFDSDYHEILFTVPESWCETIAPDANSANIMFYLSAYLTAGGALQGTLYNIATVDVPPSAVPTIDAFTAALNSNGVDASITGYVQNYSKVSLAMGSVAGALGSSIQSYEITGAGFSAAAASASFGPFAQTGDITFMAKVTDSRGRTATKTVTINVLPYTPVSAVSISAFRSDSSGDPDDEGTYAALKGKRVYSLLGGENTATISGRVFEKGTTPSSWSSMTDDTSLLISSLSIEKGYTAQIEVADKITSVVYVVEIPTSIVGIHILPGATGGGFGMYGREGCWDFSAPIFSPEGACPGIGDVLITFNSVSPAERFPDTTWSAIEGVFLLGADETYEAGDTGGEATHVLTVEEMPTHNHPIWSLNWEVATGTSGAVATAYGSKGGTSGNAGNGEAHNNMPPFLAVYIWERTA